MLKNRSYKWNSMENKFWPFGSLRLILATKGPKVRPRANHKMIRAGGYLHDEPEARINEIQQTTSSPSFYLTQQVGR